MFSSLCIPSMQLKDISLYPFSHFTNNSLLLLLYSMRNLCEKLTKNKYFFGKYNLFLLNRFDKVKYVSCILPHCTNEFTSFPCTTFAEKNHYWRCDLLNRHRFGNFNWIHGIIRLNSFLCIKNVIVGNQLL